jgi:hypothetical protein
MDEHDVTTLALGSQPKQGFTKLQAKKEARSHTTYSQECERCEGLNPPTPREFHFGSWNFGGPLNFQRAIARVKIQWIEKVLYIIENILKRRYLKWACIAHLNI